MATESLSLRIGAMFIIFVVSVIGFMTPFGNKKDEVETPQFKCMKATGAGVMLGIAMIHLMPDADGDLSEVGPDFPLAYTLTAAGIILVLTF